MKDALQRLSDAYQANIDAAKVEMNAKEAKRKAYYELLSAKENVRMVERDMFDNMITKL